MKPPNLSGLLFCSLSIQHQQDIKALLIQTEPGHSMVLNPPKPISEERILRMICSTEPVKQKESSNIGKQV